MTRIAISPTALAAMLALSEGGSAFIGSGSHPPTSTVFWLAGVIATAAAAFRRSALEKASPSALIYAVCVICG